MKAKPEKMFAFTASGRWTQVHYVKATSVAEARKRFDADETDDCLDFTPVRTGARRTPDLDEPV